MPDPQQDAIDAANRELRDYSAVCYCPGSPEYVDSLDKIDEGDAAERAIAAAEPHLRRKWAEELVERIGASNLGAPLRIDPDGTFRMANGPEMRALLCKFIMEGAGE